MAFCQFRKFYHFISTKIWPFYQAHVTLQLIMCYHIAQIIKNIALHKVNITKRETIFLQKESISKFYIFKKTHYLRDQEVI